jgi:arylsulfatase A-like enzyme
MPYTEDTVGITVKDTGPHWGTHGGLTWLIQHVPLVISGPGIRHGSSTFPAKLVDIAPTIERLIGLPIPKQVDGVVLADALAAAPSSERSVQTGVQSGRSNDVSALQKRSAQQGGIVLHPAGSP